eukprot:SAG11_NODE_1378_length_5084_cov_3.339619_2_plen_66_part_00
MQARTRWVPNRQHAVFPQVDVSRIIWIEGLVEVGADSACKTPPGMTYRHTQQHVCGEDGWAMPAW